MISLQLFCCPAVEIVSLFDFKSNLNQSSALSVSSKGTATTVIWLAIPQATEWERIGNQIDATMIFARANFINVLRASYSHSGPAGSLRECGFVDSRRGVTGRCDMARWDLQKRTNARRTGRTRAMQWGLPRLKAG